MIIIKKKKKKLAGKRGFFPKRRRGEKIGPALKSKVFPLLFDRHHSQRPFFTMKGWKARGNFTALAPLQSNFMVASACVQFYIVLIWWTDKRKKRDRGNYNNSRRLRSLDVVTGWRLIWRTHVCISAPRTRRKWSNGKYHHHAWQRKHMALEVGQGSLMLLIDGSLGRFR